MTKYNNFVKLNLTICSMKMNVSKYHHVCPDTTTFLEMQQFCAKTHFFVIIQQTLVQIRPFCPITTNFSNGHVQPLFSNGKQLCPKTTTLFRYNTFCPIKIILSKYITHFLQVRPFRSNTTTLSKYDHLSKYSPFCSEQLHCPNSQSLCSNKTSLLNI